MKKLLLMFLMGNYALQAAGGGNRVDEDELSSNPISLTTQQRERIKSHAFFILHQKAQANDPIASIDLRIARLWAISSINIQCNQNQHCICLTWRPENPSACKNASHETAIPISKEMYDILMRNSPAPEMCPPAQENYGPDESYDPADELPYK